MSTLKEMLALNDGSFTKAEVMGLRLIKEGRPEIWLDLALLYSAQGNKQEEWEHALSEYTKVFPDCPRARYGQGFWKMRQGDFSGLAQFVENGRAIRAFGHWQMPQMRCPAWDGKASLEKKTVVLWGEGGQGDQVIGLRAASWLQERGAKVVAGVSAPLLDLARHCPGVTSAVERESSHCAGHDYYLQGMSAPYICGKDWETLWPGPYVTNWETSPLLWDRIVPREPGRLNVGLRWRGNPEYDEENLRWFPPQLMLALADLPGVNFYSLQKDDPQILPDNVIDLEPLLSSWSCTVSAVARLDVVITACTSIAHVAAAMGKPTWVIVPVLGYYPWARPGMTSQWYPSVRLYRQPCYGTWDEPFAHVRQDLTTMACQNKGCAA